MTKTAANSGFCNIGAEAIPSALVRYWALVRAEVFQSSFVLYLYICFSIGQRFRAEDFQIPQHRKALSLSEKLHQDKIPLIDFTTLSKCSLKICFEFSIKSSGTISTE
jgi:hypothetical protein